MERSRCASETFPSVTASRIGSSATAAARMTSSVVATANHGSRRYSGAGGAAESGSSVAARESLRERCRGEGATDSGVEWTSGRYGTRRSRNVTFSRDASATSGRGKAHHSLGSFVGYTHGQPPQHGNQPVLAAAREQSRGLASVGRGGAQRGAARGQTDPPQRRLRRVPLVPRHGARVVRG